MLNRLKKHNWPYNKLRGYNARQGDTCGNCNLGVTNSTDTESRKITQRTYINAPLFETFLSLSSDPTADPGTITLPDPGEGGGVNLLLRACID
jgi:hypothetical protein